MVTGVVMLITSVLALFASETQTTGTPQSRAATQKTATNTAEQGQVVAGTIRALDPQKKEITILTRAADGSVPVIVAAAGDVRWLRYAPDSLKAGDAHPSSFAELRVGDHLRARGEMSADGTHFTPEQIISGTIVRVAGRITDLDSTTRTLTVKDDRTGRLLTVIVGQKSSLKKVPAELISALLPSQTRPVATAAEANRKRSATLPTDGPTDAATRTLPQLLAALPLSTLADLNKGEMVLIVGSSGADLGHVTIISQLAGDSAVIKKLQQLMWPNQDAQEMNTGLPGDVLGDGTVVVDHPKTRPDPPL